MAWTELQQELESLRQWEKRKRREHLLLEAFVYGAAASLVTVPLERWLPGSLTPLWLAPCLFIVIAAFLLVMRRFRSTEFLYTLNRLDHELGLEERALTAWELLSRRVDRAPERLVLEEAEARLKGVKSRGLFRREFGWQAYAAPVLLVALLLTAWLPVGSAPAPEVSATLAEEVKQLASETEKEARRRDLAESRRVAKELADVAQKNLRGESNEAELGYALGAIIDSIDEAFRSLSVGEDVDWPGIGAQQLSELQERLQELQGRPSLSGSPGDRRGLLDQLGIGSTARRSEPGDDMNAKEIQEFLDKLSHDAKAEQDRRLLNHTRKALSQLLPGNPQGSGLEQFAAPGIPEDSRRPEQEQGLAGRLPGDAPATENGVAEAYDPAFRARVRSHLQGLLGEGPSRGFGFRGQGKAGESSIPDDEVVVRYERQIEEQMSSEEIPADFKETIKNYFLSLGVTQATR